MAFKVLRWCTVLALALTVPLQGFAAVTGGLCMAIGHHGSGAGHSHAVEGVRAENTGNVQGHEEHRHHTHSSTALAHSDADHSPGNVHCAPCVACCAATAIASSASLFVPDAPPASAIASVAAAFAGVPPDQIDRPPLAL